MKQRRSGILLHISSLGGKEEIGTLGNEAYRFVDFLRSAKQSLWQILPLGPTGFGNSPYSSFSAFAGNPLFINLEHLYESLDLELDQRFFEACNSDGIVDYERVKTRKKDLLDKAAEFFIVNNSIDKAEYVNFLEDNTYWIESFSLFTAVKEHFNEVSFLDFDDDIKLRKKEALKRYSVVLGKEIERVKVIQFFFFEQWTKLKKYANDKNIEIVGDIPIYVAGDSADVWEHSDLFLLDENRKPVRVAGVPPDNFSETGQLWGNPIYNWPAMKKDSYAWWMERLKMNFKMFDIVRIDHFRGFAEYWSIPAEDETAEFGEWIEGPGYDFFETLFSKLGHLNIIAEDLGVITPSVEELLEKCGFPGMKILQFAFDSGAANVFSPHRFPKNCVVYTGTHDNDTSQGWYLNLSESAREYFHKYTSNTATFEANLLVKTAWSSVADMAFAPMQDILNLNTEARMNFPGKAAGNWSWRLTENQINQDHIDYLQEISQLYERNLE